MTVYELFLAELLGSCVKVAELLGSCVQIAELLGSYP